MQNYPQATKMEHLGCAIIFSLDGKKNIFLDVCCHVYKTYMNTLFLQKMLSNKSLSSLVLFWDEISSKK